MSLSKGQRTGAEVLVAVVTGARFLADSARTVAAQEAYRVLLERTSKYAEILDMQKTEDGIALTFKVGRTQKVVKVSLREVRVSDDETHFSLNGLSSDVLWLDQILKRFFDGKSFPIPKRFRQESQQPAAAAQAPKAVMIEKTEKAENEESGVHLKDFIVPILWGIGVLAVYALFSILKLKIDKAILNFVE